MAQPSEDQYARMSAVNHEALIVARGLHDSMLEQHVDTGTIWFVNVLTAYCGG
jgi:hypothetical protein